MQRTQDASKVEFVRVQRPTDDLPVVHLEAGIPTQSEWRLTVEGLVDEPRSWAAEEVRCLASEEREWDLNCVWGWVRPSCRWQGVNPGKLLDAAKPLPEAGFVVAEASGGPPGQGSARIYASCLSIDEARRSLIAWKLDGEDLSPEHGGPLRLVPPPGKWGYKGVKWLTRLRLVEAFSPGFWEEMVGNPVGDIPAELLENRFE